MKKNMKIMAMLVLILVGLAQVFGGDRPNYPFPQQLDFPGCIKPGIDQASLDKDLADYYDKWKANYLKQGDNTHVLNGKTFNTYYLKMFGLGSSGTIEDGYKSTSEAIGWGMIISVLMAGHDQDAQEYFNGFYAMSRKFKSAFNDNLMSWNLPSNEDPASVANSNGATDGDLDMAYALLLAHKQWGSDGDIDYQAEAKNIIENGILTHLIDSTTHRTLLGDWIVGYNCNGGWEEDDTWNRYNRNQTRSSDWMPAHLRSYLSVVAEEKQPEVQAAIDEIYECIESAANATTGLVPDFLEDLPVGGVTKAQPVLVKDLIDKNDDDKIKKMFLEHEHDDKYYWNATRFPMRMIADYIHYGSPEAKASVTKIATWVMNKFPEPEKECQFNNATQKYEGLPSEFTLDGNPIQGHEGLFWASAFGAPLITSSILDVNDENQKEWLSRGWKHLVDSFKGAHATDPDEDGYFDDTISLLCMMIISGNYWSPVDVIMNTTTEKLYTDIDDALTEVQNGQTLHLSQGRFYGDELYSGKFGNFLRYDDVVLSGKSNVTIQGSGSLSSRGTTVTLLKLENCNNITVKNLCLAGGYYYSVQHPTMLLDYSFKAQNCNNVTLYNNRIYTTGVTFDGGSGHNVIRNVFVPSFNYTLDADVTDIKVLNNTFSSFRYYSQIPDPMNPTPSDGGLTVKTTNDNRAEIKNNIFMHGSLGITIDTNITAGNNRVSNNMFRVAVIPANSANGVVTGWTVSQEKANDNIYVLDAKLGQHTMPLEDSPAVDKALEINGVNDDVLDGQPDIGAIEYRPPVWEPNQYYAVADRVIYQDRLYEAVSGHYAYSEEWTPVAVPTLWTDITMNAGIERWELNKTYKVGDIVTYDGNTYVCIQAHTVYSADWTPANVAALWTAQ